MNLSRKTNPACVREIIQETEKYGALEGSTRVSKRSEPFSSYVALICDIVDQEPTSYEEAIQKRMGRRNDGRIPVVKNDVWDIMAKPKNKSVVSSKWIYKIKHAVDGIIEKYKERSVARGFSQKEGIDYEETFAPVARYTSIKTIMALASMMKWNIHKIYVKTTFLNGVIEEEVYIE